MKNVDEIVTVEEEEIASAILLLLEREKTLAEGAGAAGLAALLHHKLGIEGKRVAVTVCGGNIDVTLLSRIIERGLVKDGRLVRLRIHLPDHPGALMKLTAVIAGQNANIVETNHNRALLRGESGRYGHRHYDGNTRAGACRRTGGFTHGERVYV